MLSFQLFSRPSRVAANTPEYCPNHFVTEYTWPPIWPSNENEKLNRL